MRNRPLCSGSVIVFFLLCFMIMMGGEKFVKEFRPSLLEELDGKGYVRVLGQVYDIEQNEKYQILYLKNNSIIYQNKSFNESKIIIHDDKKMNIEIGNQVLVTGEVRLYERERNPGNFNQKLYYQKLNIHAYVWAKTVKVSFASVWKVKHSLYVIRQRWREMLCEILGKEDGATLAAMLLAEKAFMNEETKNLYQANGISHLLSISGLHLSIIGVGLYKVFRKTSGSFLIGGVIGICFLMLYILMIGISVSVLRAVIMFLFYVGADMTGRHYDRITALTVAATITILWRPLYLYEGGFWLSYGAVLALIVVMPVFQELPFQGFWASVSINIVTTPILLFCFYEVPLYSIVLNMVVIPLMTILLFSGILGSVFCLIFIPDSIFGMSGIGGSFFSICKWIFWIYENLCNQFLGLPMARIVAGKPEEWKIGIYYICLFIAIVWWKRKKRIVIGMSIIIFAFIFLFLPLPARNRIEITMLDVGQGDCILIQGLNGKNCLIDGGSSDVKSVGKYRIEPFLKCQGIGRLDYVFLSHGDSDHINGIEEMIERRNVGVAIETIVFPDRRLWDEKMLQIAKKAREAHIRVMTIQLGDALKTGGFELTCMGPVLVDDEKYNCENMNVVSMILALKYGEFNMLFTGDTELEGEDNLTKILKNKYMDYEWEILKVAHHGSKNSSSEEFLEVLQPKYALISAGRNNHYGHPHRETLDRLKKYESKIISTQKKGAVRIITNGQKMMVGGYLE